VIFLFLKKSLEICGYIHQTGNFDSLTTVVMNVKNHSRVRNHSRITQWRGLMQFMIPVPILVYAWNWRRGWLEARLQVCKVTDKIIYVQGECRWKEVYWIYIFHAGSCFQIQRGQPCCTLSYLVGLWPSCQHIICPDVVLNHHWWELRYFLVTMKWNLSN
jgi:hypothetical protein